MKSIFIVLKIILLCFIYIVSGYVIAGFVVPIVPILLCMESCRNLSILPFLKVFYFASFIIAILIVFFKNPPFKQWQIFFIANGLFAFWLLLAISHM